MKKRPLVNRVYKYKNAVKTFFCPLCSTERAMTISPRVTAKNFVQILLTSIIFSAMLFPFVGVRGFSVFFVVWGAFELAIRSDFKKQVPCPHCGFDATWYKKDVKVARKLVKDFWEVKNGTSSPINSPSTAKQS